MKIATSSSFLLSAAAKSQHGVVGGGREAIRRRAGSLRRCMGSFSDSVTIISRRLCPRPPPYQGQPALPFVASSNRDWMLRSYSSSFSVRTLSTRVAALKKGKNEEEDDDDDSEALLAASEIIRSEPSQKRNKLVTLPPNLNIDPRSVSSPFYKKKPIRLSEMEQKLQRERNGDAIVEEDAVLEQAPEEQEEEQPQEDKIEVATIEDTEPESAEDGDAEEYDDEEEEEEEDDDEPLVYDLRDHHFQPREPVYAVPLPERLHVKVWNKNNPTEEVGTIHLNPVVFGQDPVRVDLIKRVVHYQQNKKKGKNTVLAKTIATRRGSGKKVRKQKGSGMARAGHRRPPHWRGGAVAHGPKGIIHDRTTKLNRRVRKLGLVHVLSQKLLEGNLIVVNDWFLETHKTGQLQKTLHSFPILGERVNRHRPVTCLIMDAALPIGQHSNDDDDRMVRSGISLNLYVAANNLPKVKVKHAFHASVWDILRYHTLVLSLSAVEHLEERLRNVTY